MKKIFTLLAVAAMAFSASAQTETFAADGTQPENNTVTLPSIKAEFLDNTSKGSVAGEGVWNFNNKGDIRGDQNGMEIRFTPSKSGKLEIIFAAAIATNKSINMFVNGDAENTIACTLPDGSELASGAKPAVQIESGEGVTYELTNGNVYNFYAGGTKWRLKSFSFTPGEESAITDIAADENAPVEYFNLQGMRVENPANGLFIKRQGSKVSKVIIK